jgi:histidinol-phosphate aminotransferase
VDEVLLAPNFQLQVEKTLAAVRPKTKLLFLCSPNNPTGNSLNRVDILAIADAFNGILVLDEAYIDFSEQESFAKEVRKRNNLVVLQTMSKSFGLAGIRLGIAIASPEIIELMLKVKAPYNVNKLTSKTAIKGFEYTHAMQAKVAQILEEREKVILKLLEFPQVEKVYPTDANFLIFKITDTLMVYKKLAAEGIIVRYRGNEPHCQNCLRLTIGSPHENERFFEALEKILN